ncbi:hypothetical protein QQS21_008155 [Conoideocrella luteorostrata]|uniref:Uncharacterized protein n=1 Tax=Conoideocrella luteorostrata TaxID=1105319 RepID=A0AAJ0CNT0_9HYPO|nr:hypothetical protein QQS21_008155 [Conoideocrella luteorostrata]
MASKQPNILTPELVKQIQGVPSLPPDSWYFISAAVLCALNRPNGVADLFRHAMNDVTRFQDQRRIAMRYREALIKVIPISGMPRRRTPADLLDKLGNETVRSTDFTKTPAREVLTRGQRFVNAVYADKSASPMNVMDSCGTPDLGASARVMYAFY